MVTCAAIRQDELGTVSEFLDEAEDVIPAAAVQPGRMIAQLVEDLVHLERGRDRFDQHRRPNRSRAGRPLLLREYEDVVPQPRFEVALHLGQVEVWSRCLRSISVRQLWKKYRPKSNSEAEIGAPSTRKCFSTMCQPRGRTNNVAGVRLSSYCFAFGTAVIDGRACRHRAG